MKPKKFLILMSLMVAFTMLLAACGARETEAPAVELTEVEVEVPEPTEPEIKPTEEKVVEPTEAPTEEVVSEPTEEAVEEPSETAGVMDVYRIAILADITSSNVWNLFGPGASAYNYVVQSNYWPGLFTLSDKRFDFVPQVAADFNTPLEQEGDFWVSTVPLKAGMLWSDGTEITAEDVAFTAQVVQDFDFSGNWDYASSGLDHIEVIDPYTVKLYYTDKPGLAIHQYGVLQNPIVNKAYWEPKLADAYVALEKIADLDPESEDYIAGLAEAQEVVYGAEATGEPIYGAFEFEKWEVGAFVENVANPSHFFKDVVVEEYTNGAYLEYLGEEYKFSAYGEPSGDLELAFVTGPHTGSVLYSVYSQDAAVLALMNGDVDYIYNPSGYGPGLKAQLQGTSGVTMNENPRNGFRFLAFNFRVPPLDDIAVRQAITCMIDKEFLTLNILQGSAFPVYTPVPEGLGFWYNPDVTRICYGLGERERMEWAVEKLKEAGYSWDIEPSWNEARGGSVDWGEGLKMPNGQYVPELLMLAPSPGYDPLRATSGVLIEQWAGMLGFPVRAQLTNFNNILNETLGGGGNWDLVVVGWNLTMYPDHMCDFFLEQYGGPFAFTGYAGEDLISYCESFLASTDLDEAKEIAFEMQEVLATDLPYTYLFANPVLDAYNIESVAYPYTQVLDGIEGLYGMQNTVKSAE